MNIRMPAAFCLILALGGAQGAERYEGVARALRGNVPAYTETHWHFDQAGGRRHLVLYRCTDGTPFARKLLLESPSAQAPDFEFLDARDGYREGVRTTPGGVREVFVQAAAGERLQARPLAMPPDGVIDAGFDQFVRARWASLANGRPVTVPFLVPSRFEHLGFSIAGAQDGEVDGQRVRRLRMKLAAWYGFALPGIDLAYEPDGRRLVAFQGLGTIRDRQGRHLDVRITFPAGLRVPSVPQAEVGAALGQALASRCPGDLL